MLEASHPADLLGGQMCKEGTLTLGLRVDAAFCQTRFLFYIHRGREDWGADLDLHVSVFMFLAPSTALLTLLLRQKVTGVQTCVCVQLLQPCPTPLTLRTVARQPPLCMRFSRQEHWSGLPCPPLEDLPNQGSHRHLLRLLRCSGILYH